MTACSYLHPLLLQHCNQEKYYVHGAQPVPSLRLCYFSSLPSREGIEPNFLQIPPKEGENVELVFCYSHIQRICEEMDRFFLESTVKCGSLPILYQIISSEKLMIDAKNSNYL